MFVALNRCKIISVKGVIFCEFVNNGFEFTKSNSEVL